MNSCVLLTLAIVLPCAVQAGEPEKYACPRFYYWNPSTDICQHCGNVCHTKGQCLSGHEPRDKACLEDCTDHFLTNVWPKCSPRDPPESNATSVLHPVPGGADSSDGRDFKSGLSYGVAIGICVVLFIFLPAILVALVCCCRGRLKRVVVRIFPEFRDHQPTVADEEHSPQEVHGYVNGDVPRRDRPPGGQEEVRMNGHAHAPEEGPAEDDRNGEAEPLIENPESCGDGSMVGSMYRLGCTSDTLNNLNVPPEHFEMFGSQISAESPEPSTSRGPFSTSTPNAPNGERRNSGEVPLASFDMTGLTGEPPQHPTERNSGEASLGSCDRTGLMGEPIHHPTEETQACSSGNSANLIRNYDSQEALDLNAQHPILEATEMERVHDFLTTNETQPVPSMDQGEISLGYASIGTERPSLRNHGNLTTSGQQPELAGAFGREPPSLRNQGASNLTTSGQQPESAGAYGRERSPLRNQGAGNWNTSGQQPESDGAYEPEPPSLGNQGADYLTTSGQQPESPGVYGPDPSTEAPTGSWVSDAPEKPSDEQPPLEVYEDPPHLPE